MTAPGPGSEARGAQESVRATACAVLVFAGALTIQYRVLFEHEPGSVIPASTSALEESAGRRERQRDHSAFDRRFAVWLVARLAYPIRDEAVLASVVPSLLAALNDPSAEVRQGAASGLGNLASSRLASDLLRPTVPALTRGLQDPDARVRRYAATALGGVC